MWAFLVGMLVMFGAAGAQALPQPPVVSAVDQNGVNLATGLYSDPDLNVSIGGLSRVASATAGADNWSGSLDVVCRCPRTGWAVVAPASCGCTPAMPVR
ncbi:hypothetical protein ABI_13040 [Asticcacaulis biprosthecium C19]|uniref:Uncharacterized protein n=1 Tax=Asticcacaulis biprosthecium C19 TaxID=715226 RepID=F4QHZ9_9CAUL|nr:hypothetical protein ABI_13040 [Asticcacaulis biprosthecium C19]